MNQSIDPQVLRGVRFALLADDADLGARATAVTLPDAGLCSGATGTAVTDLVAGVDALGAHLRALSDGLERVVALAGDADGSVSIALDLLAAEVV